MTTQEYTIRATKLRTAEDREAFKNDPELYLSKDNYWLITWDCKDLDSIPRDAPKIYQSLRHSLIEMIEFNSNPNLSEISLPVKLKYAQSPTKCTEESVRDSFLKKMKNLDPTLARPPM